MSRSFVPICTSMTLASQIPDSSPRGVSYHVSLLRLLYQNSLVSRQIAELEQMGDPAAAVSVPV